MIPYTREVAQNDFIKHGETWLQTKLKDKLDIIFDVGSNMGEWTFMAQNIHTNAEIHTFEIIPETYRKFLSNIPITENIVPNGFGLSNSCGTLKMKYRPEYDVVSTYLEELAMDNAEYRDGLVMTGDSYVQSRRIDFIDFLKVDTEGAEGLVLQGFKETLKQGKIGIIQFEYGYANILSRWLLLDAYKLLRPLGYFLGELHNGQIKFHEYALYHEKFDPPYYVAVHETKMHLID
jgi:FkbM family methyltransferase